MPKGIATDKQKEACKRKSEREKLEANRPPYRPWNESMNDPRTR